ncbi:MAG: hypothetical protein LQ346_007847 [Caloplaca aetnensis]|nr:MAG: hypothetical protein LQ346_007847 [Caloplaca aetnensis]
MLTQITPSASNFLTNLRLLDLDLQEDWPSITTELFATKNARANQKQRIQCVEWALYQLFQLWNPKETKNKLQPFFPAYDALRSINLRAALFRCLNDLKKDGVLGKDITIRKSMFDDCGGERFEELLASFSILVLQKRLQRQACSNATTSRRLATGRSISAQEQRSLLPLAIAHQAALKALLQRKAQLRQRYADLEALLKAKEQQLLAKVDDLAQADMECSVDAVPDRTVRDIHHAFEKDWQGDAGWIKSIIEGDKRDFGDTLLDSAFSKVWAHAESGAASEIEADGQKGLRQDLNDRIHGQQMRLRHWQNVHRDMVKSRPRSPTKLKENVTPYRNRGMQSPLKFGYMDEAGSDGVSNSAAISPETKMRYHELLGHHRGDSETVHAIEVSTPSKQPKTTGAFDSALPFEAGVASPPTTLELTPPTTPGGVNDIDTLAIVQPSKDVPSDKTESVPTSSIEIDERVQGNTQPPAQCDDSSPAAQKESRHEEDALAQQIISSTMNTDPSPVKCKISLMERTRQSIAFARPEAFLPDSLDGSTLFQSSQKSNADTIHSGTLGRSASLLERTRRSISLLPAPKGPRKSVYGRRESKQYPRNQFETPKKQLEDLTETTPPELLFSPDADYTSVFKSRPKIATSPKMSPTLATALQ